MHSCTALALHMCSMLRIARATAGRQAVVLRLEGTLVGPWVDELSRVCEPVLGGRSHLRLDLGGVSFVSREGAALLGSLRHRGAALDNCSTFVAEQLKAAAGSEHTVQGGER